MPDVVVENKTDVVVPDEGQPKYKIKVYGEEKELSLPEILKTAEKAAGAELKFQEANAISKKYEQLVNNIKAMDQDDPEATREVLTLAGWDKARIEEYINGKDQTVRVAGGDPDYEEEEAPPPKKPQRRAQNPDPAPTVPAMVGYDQLNPQLRKFIGALMDRHVDETIESALDKDEVIGYNTNKLSDADRADLLRLSKELVQGRLARTKEPFGAGTLASVLPHVRVVAKALGTPKPTSQSGLGPAPGTGDAPAYPTKKPKLISSRESMTGFQDSITEMILYHLGQQPKK